MGPRSDRGGSRGRALNLHAAPASHRQLRDHERGGHDPRHHPGDGLRGVRHLDGACLRGKCEEDHDLGYELLMRFAQVIVERLQATRLQLLDVYGHVAG